MRSIFLLAVPATVAAVACSARNDTSGVFDASGTTSSATTTTGAGGSSHTSSSSDASSGAGGINFGGGGPTGTSSGAGGMEEAEVYAHSASDLYKLDPNTKVVTTIGQFNGCSSVIDIAIDKNGAIIGTTFDGLYAIDKTNAKCTFIASGSYPNSLSFVPQGTLDPNVEALVGYEGSQYVRIDPKTGAITNVGTLGNGLNSSGDIVSVIGGGTYLTVNGNNCNDCIIQVDPKTGAMIKIIGALGHPSVYGLAFWAGTAYGFDDAGELFAIDLTNGVTSPIPTGMGVLSFWGAGSTTAAPLTPPK